MDIYNEIAKGVATSEGAPLFDMNEFTKRFPPEETFSDYSHHMATGLWQRSYKDRLSLLLRKYAEAERTNLKIPLS